jgi:hypothetical protein
MKKFVLSIIIAAGGMLAQTAHAQVGVNVGVRVGPLVINVHKPVAPAVVYDDYYYLPDVDAYYSVPENCYYYMDDDRQWVNARYLPGRYHDYDWRNARRYEVRAQRPYNNHDFYRNKFGGRRVDNWNNYNQYANRGPERRNDRGYDRRFPDSPYDSNNVGGRGDNWNNRRDDDRDNSRNNWNKRDNGRGDRRDDRKNNWGQDRNQGGYPGRNNNQNDGRNNDQRGNQGMGNYGQPTNQNGGRNDRDGNRDRGYQQRYTQNNDRGVKPQFGSTQRMMF